MNFENSLENSFENSAGFAKKCDKSDTLRKYRDKFYIPKNDKGEEVIYFCGNSLGLQPKTAREYIEQELKDWELLGIDGVEKAKNPWLPYHELLANQTAEILGAKETEVVNMNSLSVNLHLLMASFYTPTKERNKILIEGNAFPSDQYAVRSQIRFHGFDPAESLIEIFPKEGDNYVKRNDLLDLIDEKGNEIALIMLAGVNYYNGQAFDMKKVTELGHKRGCRVGFDLAHAAGNISLNLHDWNVDFAVWCNYKYLNGGPGAIGGAFVHERFHSDLSIPKLEGWWGNNKKVRFLMKPEFDPINSVESWQLSNPPIFQLASLKSSLDIFKEAGIENLRSKSEKLTGYLEFLIKENIPSDKLTIITPEEPIQRGCQLSLRIKNEGRKLYEALNKNDVICDWREPNVVRLSPVPLYNSFEDVYNVVEILKRLMK
ncbi:kynureninase [soil metagenome]